MAPALRMTCKTEEKHLIFAHQIYQQYFLLNSHESGLQFEGTGSRFIFEYITASGIL